MKGYNGDDNRDASVNALTDNTAKEAISKLENRRIEIIQSVIQKKRGREVL